MSLRTDSRNIYLRSESGITMRRVGAVVPLQGHLSFWLDPQLLRDDSVFIPDKVLDYIQGHDVDRIYAYHKLHGLVYTLKTDNLLLGMKELKRDGGIFLPYSALVGERGRAGSVPFTPEGQMEVL